MRARLRPLSVEPEDVLVAVRADVLGRDESLVGRLDDALEQRQHPLHGQKLLDRLLPVLADDVDIVLVGVLETVVTIQPVGSGMRSLR